jgi:hypothetical protein
VKFRTNVAARYGGHQYKYPYILGEIDHYSNIFAGMKQEEERGIYLKFSGIVKSAAIRTLVKVLPGFL